MSELDFIRHIANEIRTENRKGANSIVIHALSNLIKAIHKFGAQDLESNIETSCRILSRTQPTMAPVINSMALVLDALDRISQKTSSPGDIKIQLIREIEGIIKNFEISLEKILINASSVINNGANILTFSFSSTVFEAIKYQKTLGKYLKITITEARPNNEGILGAKKLAEIYPTTLFIDAGIGKILMEHSITLVLIGADTITPMHLIHKIGTLPLAITAHEFNTPIYALSHSLKYYHTDVFNKIPPIQLKPKAEITTTEMENVEIYNYYFDRTPLKYLTGIITENKVYDLKKEPLPIGTNFPIKALDRLYTSVFDRRD